MASATVYHLTVVLSDVDRGVYETLDLRVARHPSETLRYLLLRVLAYCLSYEEGIAFSRGGLSSTDEAPVSIFDPTGLELAWIDVGSPSADRLHKAAKRAQRVAVFSSHDVSALRREAASRDVHRAAAIEIWTLPEEFLDVLQTMVGRKTELELVRTDGELYVTVGSRTVQGTLVKSSLADE